jgi:hypothetical protein
MGKILKVLGGIFLAAVVLIGGVALYGVSVGPKLDADSKAYVDSTIPVLVNEWNPEELKSRASDQLLPFLKEPDVTNLYGMFRRLGRMTNYKGAEGDSHTTLNIPKGVVTTAAYIAAADFENGPGTIKISLMKSNGAWRILEFRVDSPIYLRQ